MKNSKPHIADVDVPLGRGSQVTAQCGAHIENTEALHVWDSGDLPLLDPPKGTCPDCLKAKPKAGRNWCYAVREQ